MSVEPRRFAFQLSIDKKNKSKKPRAYDIEKAFSEHDILPWGKRIQFVEKDDYIYICLKEHNYKIMYKCVVTNNNSESSKNIDDSMYKYPHPTKEEKIENEKGTCYMFKMINHINDNRLSLYNLKRLGFIKGDIKIQSSINDTKNEALFDYIDSIFDEVEDLSLKLNDEIESEFKDIDNESKGIPEKYREDFIKVRIGQSKFRDGLMKSQGFTCAICKMNIKELLIASHIKEYSKCVNNEHSDFKNGLLLCPNHDKLFDKHLISFNNDGKMLISPNIYDYNISKLLGIEIEKHNIKDFREYIQKHISINPRFFKKEYMEFHRKSYNTKIMEDSI